MEIGDYLTNVLSINDLSSIQYYYLELPQSLSDIVHTTLSDIETKWRQSGALVITDKLGIWVFANSSGTAPFLPPKAIVDSTGYVEFQDTILTIKQQGLYEPYSLWKGPKSSTTPSSSYNSAQSPSSSSESNFRNVQGLNTKAQTGNAVSGISKDNGNLSNSLKAESATVESVFTDRIIKERFLSSVLAALSYHMCSESGFISLNARTLVLPQLDYARSNEDISQTVKSILLRKSMLLVTLDVNLTSLGSLVVKAWPDTPTDFSCMLTLEHKFGLPESFKGKTDIFLAPSGKIARYVGLALDEDLGVTVNAVESSLVRKNSMVQWKSRCIHWLCKKGLRPDVLESTAWVMVQIYARTNRTGTSSIGSEGLWTPDEKLVTIAWPALLCFHRATSEMHDPTGASLRQGYDPLSFAEGWFTGKASREAAIMKRKKERETAAAVVKAQTEVDTRTLAPSHYSPVALRRASLAGAVYPTPPDGIQPAIGATPSFDGNASTPGLPPPQSLPIDTENIVVAKIETEDTDNSLWETNGAQRDEPSSNLDFNDSANDNLFGDMSTDLFGENGVTDADFSFFDEPDHVEGTDACLANADSSLDDNRGSGTTADSDLVEANNVVANIGVIQPDVEMVDAEPGKKRVVQNSILSKNDANELALAVAKNGEMRHPPFPKENIFVRNPSPPLSPERIFKRLSIVETVSGDKTRTSTQGRTVSAFKGVEFDHSLSAFNMKYGSHGQFVYPSMPKLSNPNPPTDLPKTGYLDKRRRKRRSVAASMLNPALVSSMGLLAPQRNDQDSLSDVESPRYSYIASPTSDQDDTSNTTEDDPIILSPHLKRKRGTEDAEDDDEMTSSLEDLKLDREDMLQSLEPPDLLDPSALDGDPADWSLAKYFAFPEPRSITSSINDPEYIASAQVLADQAVSRTLRLSVRQENSLVNGSAENGTDGPNDTGVVQRNLGQAIRCCFDQVIECTVANLADIQDVQPIGQISRIPPRVITNPRGVHPQDAVKATSIFNLPPPHLEVRRAESKLVVLPSAVPFWDNLGLAPCKGGKDISAICIYPDGEGMADNVDAFLNHIRSAYESGRLGSHERFSHSDLTDGLVSLDLGAGAKFSVAGHQAMLSKIKETSTRLGALLANGSAREANIVIYHIYDPNVPELLVPICSAFHDLFGVYKDGLAEEKLPVSNELVLQLVPLDFIASHTHLVVPPPSEYARLAMEVYDRCVDLSLGTSVPSIVLEQPLPKVIDFKVTPNPSASPLQENSCMHVAYAQSVDDRWVTAAWSDYTGTQQMTASYCLGRRDSSFTTSFTDIAHEIWETTLDVISSRKVNWRIMIVKCGIMDISEIDFWRSLAATESNAQVSLTLITADTSPSLKLLPPSISIPPNMLAAHSSMYTTPVSTPQASILSPDQSGNVGTPARDSGTTNAATPGDSNAELKLDADDTLVDITDQSWGAVLSHRLNNSQSLLEFIPALVSGYLIKRSGAGPSDVPVVIEVNIVHTDANPRMYDVLLKEVLGMYRGFATLARVRGCVDPVKDGRPWHIAAAEKGVQALYILM